eukprot:6664462-Prymnesium_polylepis.1
MDKSTFNFYWVTKIAFDTAKGAQNGQRNGMRSLPSAVAGGRRQNRMAVPNARDLDARRGFA